MAFHMKLLVVSFFVLSVVSVSSFAGGFDDAVNTANNAQTLAANAKAKRQAALDNYNSPARFNSDGSFSQATSDAFTQADHDYHLAHHNASRAQANVNGLALREQIQQQQQHAVMVSNYGNKGNPNLRSQVNTYTGVKNDPGLQSQVHLDANSALVTMTSQRPATGVVITQHPPFAGESWGNTHGANNGDHGRSGTGNGSNNAANSNSAHGLGGGDHIGGGRSGGGYHY